MAQNILVCDACLRYCRHATKTNGDIKVLYVCNENYGYNLTQGKVYERACGFAAEGDSFLRACADAASRKPVYTTQ